MEEVKWGHPGALGLAGFGFNTILLQIHNLGLISSVEPLLYGFFWGGVAQVIAGIIDARRGDTFGLTAFTSYGLFWIGLSFMFLLQWLGVVKISDEGLGWTCVLWGVFTAYMTIGTFTLSRIHLFIFASLTLLFFLLAAHFLWGWSAKIAAVEGIICGGSAVYASAAVVLNEVYHRPVLPIGVFSAGE